MRLTSARPARRSAQAGPKPNQSFGKQRVRSGITSAELNWPDRRLTVNLAPAELRKEGSGFDLPIALAVLAVSQTAGAFPLCVRACASVARWSAWRVRQVGVRIRVLGALRPD